VRAAAIVVTVALVFSLSPPDPSWDPTLCRNPAFASKHKDLCNPLLHPGVGGSGECGGLCGIIRDVLGSIGLGGVL
jgi:hypothetical protein